MTNTDFTLSNVQGDILVGLSKKTEIFFFFQITNEDAFKQQLKDFIPLVTTADKATGEKEAIRAFKTRIQGGKDDVNGTNTTNTLGEVKLDKPLLSIVGVNVAFSKKGLDALGITDDLQDPLFANGQKDDAFALADKGVGATKEDFKPDWDEVFLQKNQDIHGVILIAGDSYETVNSKLDEIKAIFTASIADVATLAGDVRPGENKGHEHFGYMDGISQPALKGVDDVNGKQPLPGQTLVDLGVVLHGRGKDAEKGRPAWTKDGSFLAFRKLPQLVPEFDKFLNETASNIQSFDDFPDAPAAADILGARMVGRWKSGAPIRISPLEDDLVLANDPQRNNKFRFNPESQEICPFAAHIRKMNPRKDLDKFKQPPDFVDPAEQHLIIRRGIPFGPEVTTEEKLVKTTKHERGLYFVSYQTDLNDGFSFLQKQWANNTTFPPLNDPNVVPGFDPIIGQALDEVRAMSGANDDATNDSLPLPSQWVQSKGGEYFFSPSIEALSGVLSGNQ